MYKRRARAWHWCIQTTYSPNTQHNPTRAQLHLSVPSQFDTHQWISSQYSPSSPLPLLSPSPQVPLPSTPMAARTILVLSRRQPFSRSHDGCSMTIWELLVWVCSTPFSLFESRFLIFVYRCINYLSCLPRMFFSLVFFSFLQGMGKIVDDGAHVFRFNP
jgi:hypothetical protein